MKHMTTEEYQEAIKEFMVYKDDLYPFLALCEEAGEVSGVVAKGLRKHGKKEGFWQIVGPDVIDEVGDVLWNIAAICNDLGLSMSGIMEANVFKLKQRKEGGTLLERSKS